MMPSSSPSAGSSSRRPPPAKETKNKRMKPNANEEKSNTNPSSHSSITSDLPLHAIFAFLPCRDLGRLLLCTSKTLATAVVTDGSSTEASSPEAVWEELCLHYWGRETDEPASAREFVQQTGLIVSWERCFRELSHWANAFRGRRPHKYFTPFAAMPVTPPALTMDPSDFSLVVDVRRRMTGKRLFCTAITGSQLADFFQSGSLRSELSNLFRPNTELGDCDLEAGNSSDATGAGNKLFPWHGLVHLIRHSDQTVVRLLDLHQTDTLLKNYIIQENDLMQDPVEWNMSHCLMPKTPFANRVAGLVVGNEPPHQRLSLSSLFGRGMIRLGLNLEYTRTDTADLASHFYISGFHLHANLLSRRLQQEALLAWLLKGTDWQFAHVLQAMEQYPGRGGEGDD